MRLNIVIGHHGIKKRQQCTMDPKLHFSSEPDSLDTNPFPSTRVDLGNRFIIQLFPPKTFRCSVPSITMPSTPHEAPSAPSESAQSAPLVDAETPVNAPDPIAIDDFGDVCRLEFLAHFDPGIKVPPSCRTLTVNSTMRCPISRPCRRACSSLSIKMVGGIAVPAQ